MAKTLDDLQNLLTSHGYSCQRMLDVIVATTVATKVYKNTAGQHALEILLSIDRPNDCVAVEILQAFDLRNTDHKEATLRCLMTASGRTPLLRPALEPEGTIRIRVDCPCDAAGARDLDVLRALAVLPSFADLWYPQVTSAMQQGRFDPSKVAHLNLSRMLSSAMPAPAAPAADTEDHDAVEADETDVEDHEADDHDTDEHEADDDADGEQDGEHDADRRDPESLIRAARITLKPGANPNRLAALFRFRRWMDERGRGPCDQN